MYNRVPHSFPRFDKFHVYLKLRVDGTVPDQQEEPFVYKLFQIPRVEVVRARKWQFST